MADNEIDYEINIGVNQDESQKQIDKDSKKLSAKIKDTVQEQLSGASEALHEEISLESLTKELIDRLKEIPDTIREIESAMFDLRRVTHETDATYNRFLESASQSAYRLGISLSGLISNTASLVQSGFSFDDAAKLAETVSLYASLSGTDFETAAGQIIAAMEAFNIKASDSISIVDALIQLGSQLPAGTLALGEALSYSGAAMAATGSNLFETLAILSSAGDSVQTITALGKLLPNISANISDINDELLTYRSTLPYGSLDLFVESDSLQSAYNRLKALSELYYDLSDSDRARLSESLLGSEDAALGDTIFQAFHSGKIQSSYDALSDSAGSAYAAQSKWMDTLSAKTGQLEAAFQSFSKTIADSGLLNFITDLGTIGVKSIDTLVKAFNPIGTAVLGVSLFSGFKNTGRNLMLFLY